MSTFPTDRRASLPGDPVTRVEILEHLVEAFTVEAALDAGHLEIVPVAHLTVDGDSRFTTEAVRVVPDSEAVVDWFDGDHRCRATAAECRIVPVPGGDALLELRLPAQAVVSAHRIEVHDDDLALRVDFDSDHGPPAASLRGDVGRGERARNGLRIAPKRCSNSAACRARPPGWSVRRGTSGPTSSPPANTIFTSVVSR